MSRGVVGIGIPVHNGAQHLRECLDSLLAQSYSSWSAVVVNNCSTDGTGAIADEYAKRDPRIRVAHFTELLGQAANYNRAVALVPGEVEFVKVLEADNWLTEDSLAQMVRVAESDEQVGIVGCYYLLGKLLLGSGLDYNTRILSGQEAGRLLFNGVYLLGTPSTLLFRSAALREQERLFREDVFYDDTDLCLRILGKWKFGFAHRLLAFVRDDNSGAFSRYRALDFTPAYKHFLSQRFGSLFFQGAELLKVQRTCENAYYRSLGRALVAGRMTRLYSRFHRGLFAAERKCLRYGKLLLFSLSSLLDLCLNPKASLKAVIRQVRGVPEKPSWE